MRITILTEGVSEFKSLPLLYPQLQLPSRARIVKTLKINAQPDAPYPQVIASCQPILAIAKRISDKVVVLLDREQQQECPGEIAHHLESEFLRIAGTEVQVALKDRMYENWLISDIDALKSYPRRFAVDSAAEKRISPNKADNLNGLAEIKRMVSNGQYSKTEDSDRICKAAKVDRIAQNSRSFRHFLHVLGHETYRDGCQHPAGGRAAGSKRRKRR